ncbi:DUF2470 domain-containing protein [candidate division KSB1 bacterium]|nr:DUF2470 domain-containing protein [candidate division KSB1 bacterium]
MTTFSKPYVSARALMLEQNHGVLSTVSQEVPDYPFGSVTPYAIDRQGFPIILISDIAEHTKNIVANPKVSLTILDHSEEDVQVGGRVTLLANAVKVDDADVDSHKLYYRYFPQSRDYHKTHDFAFYRLQLVRVRFIGGFGEIHWLDKEPFQLPNPFTESEEEGIITHMNEDHQSALRHYFDVFKGINVGQKTLAMVGIDAEGFDVRLERRLHRFAFEQSIQTTAEARETLVAMARSGGAAE